MPSASLLIRLANDFATSSIANTAPVSGAVKAAAPENRQLATLDPEYAAENRVDVLQVVAEIEHLFERARR